MGESSKFTLGNSPREEIGSRERLIKEVSASKELSTSDATIMIDDENKNAGTPENGSLVVKRLQEEWIVEDARGECLGSGNDRESVIGMARQAQKAGRGTSISVQGEDGTHEKTLD